jgi:hypothetical protein
MVVENRLTAAASPNEINDSDRGITLPSNHVGIQLKIYRLRHARTPFRSTIHYSAYGTNSMNSERKNKAVRRNRTTRGLLPTAGSAPIGRLARHSPCLLGRQEPTLVCLPALFLRGELTFPGAFRQLTADRLDRNRRFEQNPASNFEFIVHN